MKDPSKLVVGVVYGGPSNEHSVSINTGRAVINALSPHYDVVDILIDKEGRWFRKGVQGDISDILLATDVVFNALHGSFGEDGRVQRIFEDLNIPYTGTKSFPSMIGMNKILSKNAYEENGIKTPAYTIIRDVINFDEAADNLFRNFPQPCVVKPSNAGSSIGVSIVKSREMISGALKKAFEHSESVIVEEYIFGKEATCGVVENFKEEKIYALEPIEIIPPQNKFFDYDSKYDGSTQEICPGNFTEEEKSKIQSMAIKAHQFLDCRHYSRSDFIISRNGIYILETNTLPGLTDESLLPKSIKAEGMEFSDFLKHLISLAISND
jgi:D-alanine-D-alanine ligase